jgi:hypothetical protein
MLVLMMITVVIVNIGVRPMDYRRQRVVRSPVELPKVRLGVHVASLGDRCVTEVHVVLRILQPFPLQLGEFLLPRRIVEPEQHQLRLLLQLPVLIVDD